MESPIKKVVIIGPESTGKSTVVEELAQYFGTAYVPEYARHYIDALERPYCYEDLWEIAKGQLRLEEEKLKEAQNGFLFCDTDLYVIKVWGEHKYRRCDERILRKIAEQSYDFYFLTDIDLPWEADPQREYPLPEMRQYFFNIFKEIVMEIRLPHALLSGGKAERFKAAVTALENHFCPGLEKTNLKS